MSADQPPPAFATSKLETAVVLAGQEFGRLYHGRYPDPLGFGKTRSRFSDPRRRINENRFGVLYLGQSLKVCFLEAILRDLRNGSVGDFPLNESELHTRQFARIGIERDLVLVDLRGDALVRMGIPSDVARGARQTLARYWSVAFYEHPESHDGIIYHSRLNGETNLAIYDRAVGKMRTIDTVPLIAAPGLASVLAAFRVALV